ncbi:hypothetical protein TNCV_4342301 [Trichonephila clavipes]|nr:hypothetical protein TNCV_4342301 [Trichonephila clavipes]
MDLATYMYLDRLIPKYKKNSRAAHLSLDMWFHMALNASVPPVQILIGVDDSLYPKTIQNTRVVDTEGLFSILHAENFVMRVLFLKALTIGYSHQTGMRKITDKFNKGLN